ncbi:MAG: chemotaxis protein CheB, partial [Chitinophagaceae bacterium]|nr:chemotaxis protein CheB [Chitinophagaceae bacterium]
PQPYEMIVIGGSTGSLEVVMRILQSLPKDFQTPVVLVIHRMKNTPSKLDKMLSRKTTIRNISEPEDKEPVKPGRVYLAPQNYHLLMEADRSFSLDYSEAVNYSRPSIDLSFDSFARVYGNGLMAILLSGANKDGAAGLEMVLSLGGKAIIQSPGSAEYPAMPNAAISRNAGAEICETEEIVHCILQNPINQR